MDHNIGLVVSVIFAIGSGRVRPTVYALEIKNSIYQLLTPERIGQSQNEPNTSNSPNIYVYFIIDFKIPRFIVVTCASLY